MPPVIPLAHVAMTTSVTTTASTKLTDTTTRTATPTSTRGGCRAYGDGDGHWLADGHGDGDGYGHDFARLRAAARGSVSASAGGRTGRTGRYGAAGRAAMLRLPLQQDVLVTSTAAEALRLRPLALARAGPDRAASAGLARVAGRAGGAGVLPPGAPNASGPFTSEPGTTEPFAAPGRSRATGAPGGQPLTGTVHRPERGSRGPGPGWGGGSGRGPGGGRRPRRRWIPLRYKWIAALVVLGLIFRRAVAWAVLFAL